MKAATTKRTRRTRILMASGSILTTLFAAGNAGAQLAPSPPSDATAPATTADQAVAPQSARPADDGGAEIVVTGSRLRRPELEGASPTNVLGEAALAAKGTYNIQEAINELPQLGIAQGNRTQNFNTIQSGFSAGGDYVNLRNLGTQRTLVVVNGRRFVGGDPGTSAVDLNAIPGIMVSRIDVVTGAASAVYGADAVSGVVNVILKDRFTGVQFTGRTGVSSRGDSQEYAVSGLVGSRFGGDRGGILAGVEYTDQKGFFGRDRGFGQFDVLNFTSQPSNGSAAIPNELITNGGRTFSFNANNVLVPTSTLPIEQTRFQRVPNRNLSLPQERISGAATAHFDLLENGDFTVTAFAEGSYAHSKTSVSYEPRLEQFTGSPLLYTDLDTPTNQPRVPANNPYARALIPIIGAIPAAGLTVQSRLSELPPLSTTIERDTFRVAAGLRGQLPRSFNYEVYGQYGKLKTEQTDYGAFNRLRLAQTLNVDDNGTPLNFADDRCADAAARAQGCVPFNFFGQPQPAGRPLLDYLLIDSGARTSASQLVVSGFVTGPVVSLPAGDVAIVAGAEYRRETAGVTPSASQIDNSNSIRFIVGLPKTSFDVSEVFGEVTVPILADTRFFDRLEVGGAVRHSDYSTVGSQTSWSVRGDWKVSSDLRLRSVYAAAIRAPNLRELFAPADGVAATIIDPCDTVAENGSAIVRSAARISACAADLGAAAAGFNQTQVQSQLVSSIVAGNPALEAEKARTLTAGGVLTPHFLRGLSLTSDYYHIRIRNVISTVSLQDAVNQCYDQTTRPAQFCSLIYRDPSSRQIINVNNGTFNAATETLSGVDTRINYRSGSGFLGVGGLGIDVSAGWSRLIKHDFLSRQGATLDRRLGQVGDFKNRYDAQAIVNLDDVSLAYQVRIYDSALADTTIPDTSALAALNHVPTVAYHDLQLRAAVMDDRFQFSVGVKNLFDKQPPLITAPARTIVDPQAPTVSGIYDTRGRFFYTSMSARF